MSEERRYDKCGAVVNLQQVGYWYDPDDPDKYQLSDPHELVDTEWDPQEQANVAAYLRAGETLGRWMGFSWCRFNTVPIDQEIAWHPSICSSSNMGDRDLTDGVYVWPEGFAHYVEVHQVKPPEDFLRHVRPHLEEVPIIDQSPPKKPERTLLPGYKGMKGRPPPTSVH